MSKHNPGINMDARNWEQDEMSRESKPNTKAIKIKKEFPHLDCNMSQIALLDIDRTIKDEKYESTHWNGKSKMRRPSKFRSETHRIISGYSGDFKPGFSGKPPLAIEGGTNNLVGQSFVIQLKSLRCPANTRIRYHISPEDVYSPVRDKYRSPKTKARHTLVKRERKVPRKALMNSIITPASSK